MSFWSSQKLQLTDISNSQRRFFVRVKGTPEASLAKIEEIFGTVQPVVLPEVADEFGFITEVISEAEYKAKAERLGSVVAMIRLRREDD